MHNHKFLTHSQAIITSDTFTSHHPHKLLSYLHTGLEWENSDHHRAHALRQWNSILHAFYSAAPVHITFHTGYVPPGYYVRLATSLAGEEAVKVLFPLVRHNQISMLIWSEAILTITEHTETVELHCSSSSCIVHSHFKSHAQSFSSCYRVHGKGPQMLTRSGRKAGIPMPAIWKWSILQDQILLLWASKGGRKPELWCGSPLLSKTQLQALASSWAQWSPSSFLSSCKHYNYVIAHNCIQGLGLMQMCVYIIQYRMRPISLMRCSTLLR